MPGEMKVWLTRFAAILACLQLASGARINGHIRFPPRMPRWLPAAHRASGIAALLLAIPVGFDCVAAFGFHDGATRVLAHGLIGFILFGAFAAKVVAVQRRRRPRWLIPVLGTILFLALIGLWLTSLGWPIVSY
jgi:hypothetical protein